MHMTDRDDDALRAEVARLTTELERAEAYEQQLRQLIVDVKDVLAAGNVARAQSMLNGALNDIDAQTDVVTSHPGGPPGTSNMPRGSG
jgi:hypothetical protein